MTFTKTNVLTASVFATLLICLGFRVDGVKSEALINIQIFSVAAFAGLYWRHKSGTVLFYFLLFVWLYAAYFFAGMVITDLIISRDERGWVPDTEHGGHRIMDATWMVSCAVSFVVAIASVIFYHRKVERNRTIEISAVVAFMLLCVAVYIKKEWLR